MGELARGIEAAAFDSIQIAAAKGSILCVEQLPLTNKEKSLALVLVTHPPGNIRLCIFQQFPRLHS
jgi:hypothetical protein